MIRCDAENRYAILRACVRPRLPLRTKYMLKDQILPYSVSPSKRFASFSFRASVVVAALWAAVIVALAIIHTWQVYCPVPVWDMWDGYLGFYEKISHGDWGAWFSQHNEHRLVLARLLFWTDIHWFHGASIFPLVASYILLSLIAVTFAIIIRERFTFARAKHWPILVSLFVCGWLFLLCQGENLTWAFQGQFYFAFLLPLCSLYWLQKSYTTVSHLDFYLACIFGVLAAGAMANGTIALPLLTTFALLMRRPIRRFAILAVLSGVILFLYFHGYKSPGGHSLLSPELRDHVGEATQFALSFLGNPFYYILCQNHGLTNLGRLNPLPLRDMTIGLRVAQCFGVIFIVATLYKAVRILLHPRRNVLETALILFCGYVLVSAVGATGGRFSFGLPQALTLHYTTPPIMGWACLVALYAPDMRHLSAPLRAGVVILASVLALLILSYQYGSLARYDSVFFERKVSALGLALGVRDQDALRTLTDPTMFRMIPPIAEKAYADHLSIFGTYPLSGSREQLGTQRPALPAPACEVSVSSVEPISDVRFDRVTGWISDRVHNHEEAIRLLNASFREVGYAITAPELAPPNSARVRFQGYLLSNIPGSKVTVQEEDRGKIICRGSSMLPSAVFTTKPATLSKGEVSVENTEILPGNTWTGADFGKSRLCPVGLHVYGSYKSRGDSDIGSISLLVRRGQKLLYRSGPTAGRQTLEIQGLAPVVLPIAEQWTELQFSGSQLPKGEFVAQFRDSGDGWGEWSAIAVADQARCR